MLMLALPGCAYIYQGEELGLPQIDDLPDDVLQDPIFKRSGGEMRGRDGCRVPLPWEGSDPPYGFSPDGTSTWLPQPDDWAKFTAETESADPGSMLSLYRDALRLRREIPGLRGEEFAWRASAPEILDFDRGPTARCLVNLSGVPQPLGAGWTVALASAPVADNTLPHDATAWLRA
jgi:alpha-glucosidase